MIRILDHGLDQEGRLRQLVQVPHYSYPVGAAVERGELVAVPGYGTPYAIRGCGGAGPQQDFSVGGGDGGKSCRDRPGAGDGKSFLQGISLVSGAPRTMRSRGALKSTELFSGK